MKCCVCLTTRHATPRLKYFQAHQDTLSTRGNKFNANDPNVAFTEVSIEIPFFPHIGWKAQKMGTRSKVSSAHAYIVLTIPISPKRNFCRLRTFYAYNPTPKQQALIRSQPKTINHQDHHQFFSLLQS